MNESPMTETELLAEIVEVELRAQWQRRLWLFCFGAAAASIAATSGVVDLGIVGGTPARMVFYCYALIAGLLIFKETSKTLHNAAVVVGLMAFSSRVSSFVELAWSEQRFDLIGTIFLHLAVVVAVFHFHMVRINQ